MKKIVCLLLLVLLAMSAFSEDYLAYTLYARVLVNDPIIAGDTITEWIEAKGGYFYYKSKDGVYVRLPDQYLGEFVEFLKTLGQEIEDISPQSVDLRENMQAAESGLTSLEEMLQRNLQLFDRADVDATLAIEQEITYLIEEIERYKGQLKKFNVDRAYAQIQIDLSFRASALPEKIHSSFSWINNLNLYNFVQEAGGW